MKRTCLLLVVLVGVAWAWPTVGGEAPAAAQPDLAKALAGFKGFVVGELVKTSDKSCVLLVRAVTVITGNAAPSPGLLLGKPTPLAFAMTKGPEGKKRPDPLLAKTLARLQSMPDFKIVRPGGAVVTEIVGDGVNIAGTITTVTGGGTTTVNGMQVIDDDDSAEPARTPKGALLTARVRAGADGKLVMDRVMTGCAHTDTWGGMPKLQVAPGAAER